VTDSKHIFQLALPEEDFEWALPTDDSNYKVIRSLPQFLQGSVWEPIHMELLKSDVGSRGPYKRADMPWLNSGVIILRDQAVDVVGEILRPHGVILPLLCEEARLALFTAPLVEGVLDEERSQIKRFRSGRIMELRKPVFRTAILGETRAFKLAELPQDDLYLTGDLVEKIVATGLTSGTDFELSYEDIE